MPVKRAVLRFAVDSTIAITDAASPDPGAVAFPFKVPAAEDATFSFESLDLLLDVGSHPPLMAVPLTSAFAVALFIADPYAESMLIELSDISPLRLERTRDSV
jgi:hypothetical protein